MAIYICTKKCHHGGKLYRRNDVAKFIRAEDGPKDAKTGELVHFQEVDSIPMDETALEAMAAEIKTLKDDLAEAMSLIKPKPETEAETEAETDKAEFPDKFPCEFCGKEFDSANGLRMHKLNSADCKEKQAAAQVE